MIAVVQISFSFSLFFFVSIYLSFVSHHLLPQRCDEHSAYLVAKWLLTPFYKRRISPRVTHGAIKVLCGPSSNVGSAMVSLEILTVATVLMAVMMRIKLKT